MAPEVEVSIYLETTFLSGRDQITMVKTPEEKKIELYKTPKEL
jgi:hypothetical protein